MLYMQIRSPRILLRIIENSCSRWRAVSYGTWRNPKVSWQRWDTNPRPFGPVLINPQQRCYAIVKPLPLCSIFYAANFPNAGAEFSSSVHRTAVNTASNSLFNVYHSFPELSKETFNPLSCVNNLTYKAEANYQNLLVDHNLLETIQRFVSRLVRKPRPTPHEVTLFSSRLVP